MSGIHPVDILIIAAYLAGILYLGKRSSRASHNEEGFFLAGRKLGKLYQFFLNFGNATDANGAVSTATLVYQQGASGSWLAFQTIFMNPYYWFMNVWFRRVRLVTVAELFEERLGSHNLSKIYALYQVCYVCLFIGWGNLVGYNVTASLLPKPEAAWTAQERQEVGRYRTFRALERTAPNRHAHGRTEDPARPAQRSVCAPRAAFLHFLPPTVDVLFRFHSRRSAFTCGWAA